MAGDTLRPGIICATGGNFQRERSNKPRALTDIWKLESCARARLPQDMREVERKSVRNAYCAISLCTGNAGTSIL
jgi:ferritin-like protein